MSKNIKGKLVDKSGRCVHYHKEVDIVALKCYKCKEYYACYQCHNSLEDHDFVPYPILSYKEDFVAICGECFSELTYDQYKSKGECPHCKAHFNPLCSLHHHLYFSEK